MTLFHKIQKVMLATKDKMAANNGKGQNEKMKRTNSDAMKGQVRKCDLLEKGPVA